MSMTDEEKLALYKQYMQSQTVNTTPNIMNYESYSPSEAVTQALDRLNAHQSSKPADYESKWQGQLDTMLQDILNRKDFSYDVNADPLFQQYRDQFMRNGQTAMNDAMGQAAALTGGYGNSYAQTAGQQTYNGYLLGLNDKIPELYSMAMQAYNNKTADMTNRYNALGAAEGREYGRWQDSMAQYNAELDRLMNQYNTERSYDYGQHRDNVADAQNRWNNAWQMLQAKIYTPETLGILGLPPNFKPGSSGGGFGFGGGGGGSSRGGGSPSSPPAANNSEVVRRLIADIGGPGDMARNGVTDSATTYADYVRDRVNRTNLTEAETRAVVEYYRDHGVDLTKKKNTDKKKEDEDDKDKKK